MWSWDVVKRHGVDLIYDCLHEELIDRTPRSISLTRQRDEELVAVGRHEGVFA